MKEYLNLIRIKHWLKNFLIFLPLFFSINLFNIKYYLNIILAFIIFSFSASIIYVLNDISDIEKDKLHPIKKKRPLASGKISIKQAKIVIMILTLFLVIAIYHAYKNTNNLLTIFIPITYMLLNALYSKWLKYIPIIDVVVLVSGYVFRVMYGGVLIGVEVSKYLYLMIIFCSCFLSFGKRRNEIIKNGNKSRKVLQLYNQDFLDKNMYVALALTIVSYTLWCVAPSTIQRVGNDYLFWTIPLLMIILQLYSLNIEGNSYGDPIDVILNDRKILIMTIVYILVIGGILYLL